MAKVETVVEVLPRYILVEMDESQTMVVLYLSCHNAKLSGNIFLHKQNNLVWMDGSLDLVVGNLKLLGVDGHFMWDRDPCPPCL